ncbi:hypothetical protein GDO81_004048 [Engystomops pustulosus]|uniref:Alpha-2-macroglobulin n=1 Tax=Engystomops pustulosus TaxID=76066 RepID=A0AAV6ZPK0_ENGPU|nr:hypothetical protein GDO81_004048 [Engystomops pustulosus]
MKKLNSIDLGAAATPSGHRAHDLSESPEDPNPRRRTRMDQVPSVSEPVPVAIIFCAKGANTDLRERKTVVLKSASETCRFQMDKPIYKPDQQVFFRLLCLNAQLKLVTLKFSAVYLQDPSRARIAQWLLPEDDHGVISLDFKLIREATPGSYVLIAERESGYPIRQYFTVEEYVLPRFTVDVNSPQTVSMTAEDVPVNVSSVYTYGEPMAGSVVVRYCKQPSYYGRRQNCFKDNSDSCTTMTGELDEEGHYSGVIDLYSPFMRNARGASLSLDITVTEAGTGIQVTESRYVSVTTQPARLSFDYESQLPYYMRGIKYPVVAQLNDENGQPMPNQELEVQVNNDQPQTAITDSEGRIEHEIDTSNMVEANFTVKVSYLNPDQCYYEEWSRKDFPSVENMVQRFYSFSSSFIQMKRPKGELSCGESHGIDMAYIISEEGTGAGVNSVTFYYMVISNSAIVQSGQKDIDLSTARNGSSRLDIPVSFEMAPSADMVVYAILKDEIVADTVNLNIENCFKNQVSMTFSEEKTMPGSKVDVQLSADPNSYCGLSVIDSSLLILNSYGQFSASSIYSARRSYSYGYNVGGIDVEDPAPPCKDPNKLMFIKGNYYLPVSSPSEGDTYNKLKSIGLMMGTTKILRKPEVCDNNPTPIPIVPMAGEGVGFGGAGGANLKFASLEMDSAASPRGSEVSTIRKNFLETFLWIMTPVDTQGRATQSAIVPDTITKWHGTAFCTSQETGFGMTKYAANLTTFLPMFVELSLPYSFVRGEILSLVAVVRNYMQHCIKVNKLLDFCFPLHYFPVDRY